MYLFRSVYNTFTAYLHVYYQFYLEQGLLYIVR